MKRVFLILVILLSALQAEVNLKEWKFTTNLRIKATPLIVKDSVYLSSYDSSLYKIDLNSGKEVWHFQTKNFLNSTAILDSSKLFIGSADGYFYAINSKDGSLIWKFKTSDMITRRGIVVQDMAIFGGADGYIYALNKDSGELIWKKSLNSRICADLVYSNSMLYVSTIDKKIHAINIRNQKTLWSFSTKERVTIKPIYEDAKLFIADEGVDFIAIDTNDGSKLWGLKIPSKIITMKMKNKYFYITSSDYRFSIVNKLTGKLKKSYVENDNISSLSLGDRFIIFGIDSGYLVFFDYNYNFVYDRNLGTKITSLKYFDKNLYVTDEDGTLYKFSTSSIHIPQILTPPTPL